jgi:hypothetical protein
VTLLCFSRAPIQRLTAYKERMGWQFPYVSTYNSDFAFDFNLALTEEQAQQIPEVKEMIDNPPGWLEEWSRQIGAELKEGLRENPSWIAFARENGTVSTPTRCRRPTRSSRPTSASCSNERRKPSPPNPAPGGRTNTRWRIAPRLVVLVDPPWPPPTSIGARQSSVASPQDPPQPSNGGLRPSASTQ